mgnify:CR=1 FL=1
MIRSELYRGMIYAGDTPLACSITVEQTGPMQITVRAGSFTTTGQARIRGYDPGTHAGLIASGKAERLPDGKRVRVWLQDVNGQPIDRATTYTLAADQIVVLTSDPLKPVAYDVDLISDGPQTDVLVKRRVVDAEEYGDPPPGWRKVHDLLSEFMLPPGCAEITPIDIYALTIRPGFPAGTGPDDWATQTGGA